MDFIRSHFGMLIWKKSEPKVFNGSEFHFFLSDFLQNPYFSVQNFFLFITRKIAYWYWNWKSVQKSMNEHWLRFLDQCFQGNLSLEKKELLGIPWKNFIFNLTLYLGIGYYLLIIESWFAK